MNKLSFRIWFPFTLLFLLLVLFLGFYYSQRQEAVFTENRETEVNQIGKTLKESIEQGIEENDFSKIKTAMKISQSSLDFEAISFNFFGEIIVVGDSAIANADIDEDKYFYEEYMVYSELEPQGSKVLLISSKKRLEETIAGLNRPVYFLLSVTAIIFVILIILYTRFITKPFAQLANLSQNIDRNLATLPTLQASKIDEVKTLQDSLKSLFEFISEKEKLRSVLLEELKSELTEKNLELEQLSMVAKYTTSAVIITNEKAEIIWVNEGFEKLTEYTFEEVKGMTPKMLQFEKPMPRLWKHSIEN